MSSAGNAPILNISGTISLLTGPTRCQRPDRQFYAAAYARDDGVRAGFEYFKNVEQDAKDFAALSTTKLNMPLLVLSGEKEPGEADRPRFEELKRVVRDGIETF